MVPVSSLAHIATDEAHHLAAPDFKPALADLEPTLLEVGAKRVVLSPQVAPQRLDRVGAVVGTPGCKLGRQDV